MFVPKPRAKKQSFNLYSIFEVGQLIQSTNHTQSKSQNPDCHLEDSERNLNPGLVLNQQSTKTLQTLTCEIRSAKANLRPNSSPITLYNPRNQTINPLIVKSPN